VRTRLRRLHVDGRTFRWRGEIGHVPGSGDCHRCIRVRVWGAGKTSRALQVDLLSTAWGTPWTACATDGSYPAPAEIRAVVDYAIRHGWDPDQRGGSFVLTESEHATAFAPAGFLLTDRPRTGEGEDPTARVSRAHRQRD
jgi:hypothetical protein